MLTWLKQTLRRWLVPEIAEVPTSLEVFLDGNVIRVVPQGAIGLHLNCIITGKCGSKVRLVSMDRAVDPKAFRSIWQSFQPKGTTLVWEDGGTLKP